MQGDISPLAPVADFDLEKLLGIRSGSIHAQFVFNSARVDGPNLADDTGAAKFVGLSVLRHPRAEAVQPEALDRVRPHQPLPAQRA